MSKIEWTDRTLNPGLYGCSPVSRACENCYAAGMALRLATMPQTAERYEGAAKRVHGRPAWTGNVRVDFNAIAPAFAKLPKKLKRCGKCDGKGYASPRDIVACAECNGRGKRPWRVFVTSMSDIFHEDVPFEFIDAVFVEMAKRSHIHFQVLTKRPERMVAYTEWCLAASGGVAVISWPENVHVGATVENQTTLRERLPWLLKVPACVHFLSIEPMVGQIDLGLHRCSSCAGTGGFERSDGLTDDCSQCDGRGSWTEDPNDENRSLPLTLQWVIAGGESGPRAEPSHPDWFRSLRDQCAEAGVPFLFKQWGEWGPRGTSPGYGAVEGAPIVRRGDFFMQRVGKKAAGRLLDGVEHNGFPEGA